MQPFVANLADQDVADLAAYTRGCHRALEARALCYGGTTNRGVPR